jgi:hypothetical protein
MERMEIIMKLIGAFFQYEMFFKYTDLLCENYIISV